MIEPRESAAFNAAAEDFRTKIANPAYNGAVLFAVTRCGESAACVASVVV